LELLKTPRARLRSNQPEALMSDQCPLCERPKKTSSEYCVLHSAALAKLDEAYSVWKKAFGDMTKAEYLAKVEALPETGRAVKNVIRRVRDIGAVT
jgi:hypothetical protein